VQAGGDGGAIIVILMTIVIQAPTTEWLARKLGLSQTDQGLDAFSVPPYCYRACKRRLPMATRG